jgi:tripartite-type tricarboxylate transporter receptor subunit TctC
MRTLVLLFCVSAIFAASGIRAQTADQFYKDKQITLLVSTAAGGGYDTYARTLLGKAYGAPKDIVAAASKLVP